jgi:hypothetical protein
MPCYTLTYRTEVDLSIDVEAADWDTAVAIADDRVRIELCPACSSTLDPSKHYELRSPPPGNEVPNDPDTASAPPRRLRAVR